MKKKLTPYKLLVPQMIFSAIFLFGLVTGITQSIGVVPAFGLTAPTLKYYREILSDPVILKSIGYSFRIALLSSLLATVIGVMLCGAIVMKRQNRGAYLRVIQIPIVIPHVVVALFVVSILSQNGILSRIGYALGMIGEQQEFPRFIYDSFGWGVILAYLWKEVPFIIYFVIALMANINEKLGEAAINLGAVPWTAFRKVTLPLCRNTIISGFLIIFVFALGAYELPAILGATSPRALPVLAYIEYIHPDLQNRPYAMALNGIIILLSAISAGMYFILTERNLKKLTGRKGGL